MKNLFQNSVTAIENFLAEFTIKGNETFGFKSNGEVDVFNSNQNSFKGLVASTRITDICDYDEEQGYILNKELLSDFLQQNIKMEFEM